MCQKYICDQNGITTLGELPFGKGWTYFKNEFSQVFRGLTQLGYAVVFIGHDKEVIDDNGNRTVRSALSGSVRTIITGMADIIGYAHQKKGSPMSVLTLRCEDDSIECGGRFKYIDSEILMSYDNLVNTVKKAIDKESLEHGGKYITDEKIKSINKEEYDFDALKKEFENLVETIMSKDSENGFKITSVIEHYLGKGKKASEITPYQAEFLYLINQDLKDI